jgi:hypothetical protein
MMRWARLLLLAGVALASRAPLALAEDKAPAPVAAKEVRIDRAGLLILIRQTLTALDLSNKSGNYTTLREISAPGFAAINDAARLSATFGNQRARGIDYSGTLVYEPVLTEGPEITKEGILRFSGYFPSASSQIKFEMYFAPVNGQWKLAGLLADLAPTGPLPPAPPPEQPTTQPSAKPNTPASVAAPSNSKK